MAGIVGRVAERVSYVGRRVADTFRRGYFNIRSFLRSAVRLQIPAHYVITLALGAVASLACGVKGGVYVDENKDSVIVRTTDTDRARVAEDFWRNVCGRQITEGMDRSSIMGSLLGYIDEVKGEESGEAWQVKIGSTGICSVGAPAAVSAQPATGPDPKIAELQTQVTTQTAEVTRLQGLLAACGDQPLTVDHRLDLQAAQPVSVAASKELTFSISAPAGYRFVAPREVQVLFNGSQVSEKDLIELIGATLNAEGTTLSGSIRTGRKANPTLKAGEEPAPLSFTLAALLAPVTGEAAEAFIGTLPIEVTASPAPTGGHSTGGGQQVTVQPPPVTGVVPEL